MSKFAIGEKVDNAADDHEVARSLPFFLRLNAMSDTPSIWRETARSNSLPSKN